MRNATALGWCTTHKKLLYLSRKDAKRIAKRHPGHKSPFPCSDNEELWHNGELGLRVIRGEATRDEVYAWDTKEAS
jgi:hypothetical protein